jgi:PAS domain S-box-containing protein
LYGWTEEEAIGKKSFELFQSEFVDSTMEDNAARLRRAGSGVFEAIHLTKDGRRVFVEVHSAMIPDASGNPTAYISTCRDLTERKRMEEEIRMLAKFPSENPNPILRVSKDGVLLYANAPSAPLLTMWKCTIGDAIPGQPGLEIAKSFATATQESLEIECEKRCYFFAVVPIQDAGYVNLYGRDVTVPKIAEESLRESNRQNEFLASIIESSAQPFGVGYPDGRMGLVNKAFEELTGYTADELHSVDWAQNLTPPEWNALERQKLEELAATGMPVRYEKEYVRKNGSRVPIELLVHLTKDADGNPIYYSFLTDIAQRKLAEAALLASELRYRTTMDAMMEGCQIIGRDWKYVYINQAAERHNRRPSSELIGNRYMQMWPGIESTHVFEVIRDCIENRTPHVLENEFTFPDGTVGWFDLSIQPVPEGVFILSTDITERKRTERALLESEQRLKFHFENSPLAVVEWDVNYIVTQWSKEAETIFGWSKEEVLGKRIDTLNLIYADDIPIVNRTMERLSGGKERTVVSSNRNITKDGAVIECTWFNSVLTDDKGNMSSAMSLVQDITERKRSEETLRKNQEQLSAVFNGVTETLMLLDIEGNILAANKLAVSRLGRGMPDLVGQNIYMVLPDHVRESRQQQIAELVNTKQPITFQDEFAGSILELSFYPIFDVLGNVIQFISSALDITERKRAADAMRRSEERYRNLFNSLIEGFCIVEMVFDDAGKPVDYRFLEVNETFEEQTGLHEAQGKLMRELAPDHEQHWFDVYGTIALTGEPAQFVNEARALNRWFDVRAFRIGGDESRKVAICFSDITKRKRAEDELTFTLHRFYWILSSMQTGILLVTDDNRVEFANQTFCDIFDIKDSPDDLLELTANKLIQQIKPSYSNPEAAVARISELVQMGQPLLGEEIDMVGQRAFLRDFIPIRMGNKRHGRLWVHREITDRKKMETALRRSEERFRNMFERHGAAMLLIEPESGSILDANTAAANFYGYSRVQLRTMRINDLNRLHPDDVSAEMQKAVNEQRNYFVFPHKLADGAIRWVEVYSTPIDMQGSSALFSVIHDFTERKLAGEALRQSEEKYRRIVETANEGIVLSGADGTMNFVNKKMADMLGYPLEKLLGKTTLEFMPDEEKEHVLANRAKLETKNSVQAEYCFIRNDGNRIWTFGNTVPILDDKGEHVANLAMHTDITGRKLAEEEIRRNIEELRLKNEELTQFNNVMVDREIRMIELKKEINQLCSRLGQHPVYDVDFETPGSDDTL